MDFGLWLRAASSGLEGASKVEQSGLATPWAEPLGSVLQVWKWRGLWSHLAVTELGPLQAEGPAGHIHLTGRLPRPAFRNWVCLESQHSGNLILPKVTLPGQVWRRPPKTISRSRGAGLCPTASLMWRHVHGVPQGARRVAAELPCPI